MSNRIDGEIGDDADQAAIGSNIKQDKAIGGDATNNVYIYPTPPEPERQARQRARNQRLMPEVERELRQSVDRLNTTMIRLEGTVEKNNAITIQSIDAFKEQLTTLKAQLAAAAPTWLAYFVALCLLAIAIGITVVSVVLIAGRLG